MPPPLFRRYTPPRMLTEDQRQTFDTIGWARLPGAFARVDANRMAERVWDALEKKHGFHPDRPETWTIARPTGFQNLARSGAFDALLTPEVCEAIDGLLGAGTWDKPTGGGTPLIAFPASDTKTWEVPDGGVAPRFSGAGRAGSRSTWRASSRFYCPWLRCGGGTLVLEGSHALIARLAEAGKVGKGSSADVRKALVKADPWLRDLLTGDDDPATRTRNA